MNASRSTPCVIVFLEPRMKLALAAKWPVASIITSVGQTYRPIGPAWSGFYDWLRDSDSKLLGVRYYPCEEAAFVLQRTIELNYAESGFHQDVCLFFSERRSLDPKNSVDQDFLYDQVFVADDGSVAISFAGDFTQDILNQLKSAIADWPNVSIKYGSRDV
jgi:hypothetical protein